jgi:polyketide biosynthesis enoyl-CoA hydratase PksH
MGAKMGAKMDYETLLVKESIGGLTITINRTQQKNALNNVLLKEINLVLDRVEKDPGYKMVVLEGQSGIFCTGQDFAEVAQAAVSRDQASEISRENMESNPYMNTLKRFTLFPGVVISVVDGEATAGGVGFAAASDLVIATSRARFSLSECLWGLLPAIVMPFLIRRVGFQPAYRMALTTIPVAAQEAHEICLVDEINETPQESIRRLWLRLSKVENSTIKYLKQFAGKMWPIDEQMQRTAVSESMQRFTHPGTLQNIKNYLQYKKFPWE